MARTLWPYPVTFAAVLLGTGCAGTAHEPVAISPEPYHQINEGELHYGIAHTEPKSHTVLLTPAYRHVVGGGIQIGRLTDYNATVIAPTRGPTPYRSIDHEAAAKQHPQERGESAIIPSERIQRAPGFAEDQPAAPSPETPMHPERPLRGDSSLPGVSTKSEFDVAESRLDTINSGRLSKIPGLNMNDATDRVWTIVCEGRYNELSDSDKALVAETKMPAELEPFCDPQTAIGPTK